MGGQSKSMFPKAPALTTMPLSNCKWKKQSRRKAWLDLGCLFDFQCCLQLQSFATTVTPSVHPAEQGLELHTYTYTESHTRLLAHVLQVAMK